MNQKQQTPQSSSDSKKQHLSKNQNLIDSFDYLSNAASSMDCTGLIPSAPATDAELESYDSVYHYLPPKVKPKNKE